MAIKPEGFVKAASKIFEWSFPFNLLLLGLFFGLGVGFGGEKYALLGFYIFVLLFLGPFIYALNFRKSSSWHSKSPSTYQLVNLLCIFVFLLFTGVTINEFFPFNWFWEQNIVQSFLLLLLYICFLATALGIILVGIKSIRERRSISPGPSVVFQRNVSGNQAIISGLFYLAVGGALLLFVLRVGLLFIGI